MSSAETYARKLVEHRRWVWRPGMVLIWPEMGRQVVISAVTEHCTVIVTFLGQGVGVEVDPEEQGMYPDLDHPAMVGVLLAMWMECNPQVFLTISRWSPLTGKGTNLIQPAPKKWVINLDISEYIRQPGGGYLGPALARILYSTWTQQQRMTPMPLELEK